MGQNKSWQQKKKDAGYRACTLWLPADLAEDFREQGKPWNMTIEQLVVAAVSHYQAVIPPPKNKIPWEEFQAIVGKGWSGVFGPGLDEERMGPIPGVAKRRKVAHPDEEA